MLAVAPAILTSFRTNRRRGVTVYPKRESESFLRMPPSKRRPLHFTDQSWSQSHPELPGHGNKEQWLAQSCKWPSSCHELLLTMKKIELVLCPKAVDYPMDKSSALSSSQSTCMSPRNSLRESWGYGWLGYQSGVSVTPGLWAARQTLKPRHGPWPCDSSPLPFRALTAHAEDWGLSEDASPLLWEGKVLEGKSIVPIWASVFKDVSG